MSDGLQIRPLRKYTRLTLKPGPLIYATVMAHTNFPLLWGCHHSPSFPIHSTWKSCGLEDFHKPYDPGLPEWRFELLD
jgi:hypothetical protein